MGQVTTVLPPGNAWVTGTHQPPLTFYTDSGNLNSVLLLAEQMTLPSKPSPQAHVWDLKPVLLFLTPPPPRSLAEEALSDLIKIIN